MPKKTARDQAGCRWASYKVTAGYMGVNERTVRRRDIDIEDGPRGRG